MAASILYESASDMYNRFAGGRERALALLRDALPVPGNSASAEVVTLAELEGRVAGAMAAFPVDEAGSRARAFLRLTLRSLPLERWPAALRLFWAGARAAPAPREQSLYVDALAVEVSLRRRGVAQALLADAEERAQRAGLSALSLDTSLDNNAARALYASAGFDEVAYRPPGRRLPGFVALVKRLA